MKTYHNPVLEILLLAAEDVIATSSNMGPGKDPSGDFGDGDQGGDDLFD